MFSIDGLDSVTLTPTNGALFAMLAAAGVRDEDWIGFAIRQYLALIALGSTAIGVAVAIGQTRRPWPMRAMIRVS